MVDPLDKWRDDSGNLPPTAGDVNCLVRQEDIVRPGFPELGSPPRNEVQVQLRVIINAVQRIGRMIEAEQPFSPSGLQRAECAKECRGILVSYLLGLERIESETQREIQS